jgi:leader peptidase (prepilin peptidase)/N-methyltransferase
VSDLPRTLVIVIAGIFGLILGSFLNVCIVRWGAEPKQSVVRPRSRCPRCGAALKPWDNIPVLSWLLLRGKCRSCGLPISVMYPLVELGTGVIWALVFWRFGQSLTATLELAIAVTILLGVALTDARAFVIPHEFTLGGAVIAAGFGAMIGWHGVQEAAVGACFGAGLVLLIGEAGELLLGQESMGGGDVALMGMLGAFFGWELVLLTLLAGSVISVILFALSQLFVTSPREPARATPPSDSQGLRWGMLGRLLLGGLILLGLVLVVMRLGGLAEALHMLFVGVTGAGVAYYVTFLAPGRIRTSSIARVRGHVGAAIAIGSSLRPWAIAISVVVLVGVFVWSRGMRIEDAPESTDALIETGYLPFGVGLAIAAAASLLWGGPNVARELVSAVTAGLWA